MTRLAKVFIACALGLFLGVWLSLRVVPAGSPFDVVALGPWRTSAKAGTAEADPYSRATFARTGALPLGAGEGLEFVARNDDSGLPLNPACVYIVGPRAPAARYWTLALVDAKGFPVANAAERIVFRSSEIIRSGSGEFEIAVSASVQPGNWLPIGNVKRFGLVLRLYDAPLGATPAELDRAAMPKIQRTDCA